MESTIVMRGKKARNNGIGCKSRSGRRVDSKRMSRRATTAEQRACACNEQASGRHPQHLKAKERNFEEGKRAAAAELAGGAR
jgi:hypothetical protein